MAYQNCSRAAWINISAWSQTGKLASVFLV
jgi:hypothetical protein